MLQDAARAPGGDTKRKFDPTPVPVSILLSFPVHYLKKLETGWPVFEKDKPVSDLVNNLLWSSLQSLNLVDFV